jgi:hypothetical protein
MIPDAIVASMPFTMLATVRCRQDGWRDNGMKTACRIQKA